MGVGTGGAKAAPAPTTFGVCEQPTIFAFPMLCSSKAHPVEMISEEVYTYLLV